MHQKSLLVDFGGVLVRARESEQQRHWRARLELTKERSLASVLFENEVSERANTGHAMPDDVVALH